MVVTENTAGAFVFELAEVTGAVNAVRNSIGFNPRIALFESTVPAVEERTGHGQSGVNHVLVDVVHVIKIGRKHIGAGGSGKHCQGEGSKFNQFHFFSPWKD